MHYKMKCDSLKNDKEKEERYLKKQLEEKRAQIER